VSLDSDIEDYSDGSALCVCTGERWMSAKNFDRCIALLLKEEGGYADHPSDPGGATKYGITQRTLATYRRTDVSKADVKALTEAEAIAIYRKNYWNAIRGDELPEGIDHCVFDYAVNSGPARAAKALQWAIGFKEEAVDGHIGAQTLAETDLVVDGRNGKKLISAICAGRLAFVKSLSTWGTFGKGWAARIKRVESESIKMLSNAEKREAKPEAPPVTTTPPPEPAKESSRGGWWAAIATFVAGAMEALRTFKSELGDFVEALPVRYLVWAAMAVALGAGYYAYRQRKLGEFARPSIEDT